MTEISKFRRTALASGLSIVLTIPAWAQESRTAIINLDSQPKPASNPPRAGTSPREQRTGIINLDPPNPSAPSTTKTTSPNEPMPEIIYMSPPPHPRTETIDREPPPKKKPLKEWKIPPGATPPKVISHDPTPEYSQEAREKHIAGKVVLLVLVDARGSVADIEVVQSLGYGLDEKAIEAVRKWKFEPARKYRDPIPVAVSIEVNFHLL